MDNRNIIILGSGFAITLVITVIGAIALLRNPEYLWEVGPGFVWAVILTVAFGYGFLSSLKKNVWSASTYTGNYVDELAKAIKAELDRNEFKYTMSQRKLPGICYRFEIFSPYRASITVREWTHLSYKRIGMAVPTGTVIEVKPHPSKAPEKFKEILRYALINTGLPEFAVDWY